MRSGIKIIAEEREEQIKKHGYDSKHDASIFHQHGELKDAAIYILTGIEPYYPPTWDIKYKTKF